MVEDRLVCLRGGWMGLRNFVCGAVVGGRSVFLGQLAGGLEMDQNGNCCGPTYCI